MLNLSNVFFMKEMKIMLNAWQSNLWLLQWKLSYGVFKYLNGFHISMCPITLFVCYCLNIIWQTRQHLLKHFLLKLGLDYFPLYHWCMFGLSLGGGGGVGVTRATKVHEKEPFEVGLGASVPVATPLLRLCSG